MYSEVVLLVKQKLCVYHPASSFVAGHKQLYASGYRDRKLDVSGTQRFACN